MRTRSGVSQRASDLALMQTPLAGLDQREIVTVPLLTDNSE